MESNNKLPGIQQSFINKYVSEYNKGNKIEDVMVEYEEESNTQIANEISVSLHIPESLKVNSKDNTITIKNIKDSWSKGEVIHLLDEAFGMGFTRCSPDKYNKWIETNL
jgi:hypothetical protein